MTQFQIEGGALVQGITKLITVLLTFVTLNKNYAIFVDKKLSLFILYKKYMVLKLKLLM